MWTDAFPQLAARGRHLSLHRAPGSATSVRPAGWLADSCQASGPVLLAATSGPSAKVDAFAPTPPSRRTKMCRGVLAKLPETSTWRDKPMLAPRRPQCGGLLPRIRQGARNMPPKQAALIDYRGATILSRVDGACPLGQMMTVLITGPEPYETLAFHCLMEGSWTQMRHREQGIRSGNTLGRSAGVIRFGIVMNETNFNSPPPPPLTSQK